MAGKSKEARRKARKEKKAKHDAIVRDRKARHLKEVKERFHFNREVPTGQKEIFIGQFRPNNKTDQ